MPGVRAEFRDGANGRGGVANVADVDSGRPLGPESRQRAGSTTKTFTAVAIRGERGQRISVRMVLNHTSGINDYEHVLSRRTSRASWTTWRPGAGRPGGPRADRDRADRAEVARQGLGLPAVDGGECGWLWGHNDAVFGMTTTSLNTEDGARQLTYGLNLTNLPSPIDDAVTGLTAKAMCPATPPAAVPRIAASFWRSGGGGPGAL
ncbi:D-alanyl-D-alanine carboxypeptidase [Saccharopolyspora erythraea NRRL 2338]|uniref:Uncharacterized protein n=1 Tax=Saccharopolyspora erythraea TaxID=1836 RepID=A0ABP3P6G4_SACER|nr:serine hydrolase domain-containing protein [Saccharopolyspora erythraea]EQD83460.1 hypothetical protein N599_25260 [Saccharopolyspora erythraea D]PFG99438.1 D-alanyl-D-alanine carboxypeptidase [Saccharopolyspora erythraea NRRL 2338]QRK89348.1 serine hydrolase [Saccharopolyspora erythraea]